MRTDEWKQGYDAYLEGRPRYANPFHPCTAAGDDWLDGWSYALKEDKE